MYGSPIINLALTEEILQVNRNPARELQNSTIYPVIFADKTP